MLSGIIVKVIEKLASQLFTWLGGIVSNWIDHKKDERKINDAFENEDAAQGAADLNSVFRD